MKLFKVEVEAYGFFEIQANDMGEAETLAEMRQDTMSADPSTHLDWYIEDINEITSPEEGVLHHLRKLGISVTREELDKAIEYVKQQEQEKGG